MFNICCDGLWWVLFPSTAHNLGFWISVTTLVEFVFAQTPHSVWGLDLLGQKSRKIWHNVMIAIVSASHNNALRLGLVIRVKILKRSKLQDDQCGIDSNILQASHRTAIFWHSFFLLCAWEIEFLSYVALLIPRSWRTSEPFKITIL